MRRVEPTSALAALTPPQEHHRCDCDPCLCLHICPRSHLSVDPMAICVFQELV
ncbi:hypothetical protein Hanom_Chr07g00665281 [Helianthus anomalus]